jgi:hypothetical protein
MESRQQVHRATTAGFKPERHKMELGSYVDQVGVLHDVIGGLAALHPRFRGVKPVKPSSTLQDPIRIEPSRSRHTSLLNHLTASATRASPSLGRRLI